MKQNPKNIVSAEVSPEMAARLRAAGGRGAVSDQIRRALAFYFAAQKRRAD